MEIRKAVTGAVLAGALGAAGLGLSTGVASATCYYGCTDVTKNVQKTVTVSRTATTTVSSNGQVGNGNTTQSATGNAGAISNPQLGLAVSMPVTTQNPVNTPSNSGNATSGSAYKFSFSKAQGGASGQVAKQDVVSVAKANASTNSTSVNTSADNGNYSSVNIGSSN
jgi:hypothetical protein